MTPRHARSEYSAHSAMRETARATRYTNAQRAMMRAAIARHDNARAAEQMRERVAGIAFFALCVALCVALFYSATV